MYKTIMSGKDTEARITNGLLFLVGFHNQILP